MMGFIDAEADRND